MSLVYGGVFNVTSKFLLENDGGIFNTSSFCVKWKYPGGREFCQATIRVFQIQNIPKCYPNSKYPNKSNNNQEEWGHVFFERKPKLCGENTWICLRWVFLYRILPWQITTKPPFERTCFAFSNHLTSKPNDWELRCTKKNFINNERCEIIPPRFWSAPVELLTIIDLYSKKTCFCFFGRSFGMATMFFLKSQVAWSHGKLFRPLGQKHKNSFGWRNKNLDLFKVGTATSCKWRYHSTNRGEITPITHLISAIWSGELLHS